MRINDDSSKPVAIVGGGLAGLNAARLLYQSGVDFLLFEARGRPGGRILTIDETGRLGNDGFDLGPSWFWPAMQPAISKLVTELGLQSFAQNSEGDVVFERMSREAPHRLSGMHQEPESMRLTGGSAALIRALARDLPADRLQFGARVTGMRLIDDGVELSIRRSDGRDEPIAAEHVIAALPPRVMEATIQFDSAQEPETIKRWRDTPTWMAPHAKFFAIYEHPFWRDAGFSGTAQSMVGPMVEMHDATTASGKPALFGFLGVGAEQRSAIGEEALTHACLGQFSRIFGPEASEPKTTLFKDWAADPLTATAADLVASDHPIPSNAPWVNGPWQERLSLAGSESSASEAGYLAGAIIASRRAADTVIEARKV